MIGRRHLESSAFVHFKNLEMSSSDKDQPSSSSSSCPRANRKRKEIQKEDEAAGAISTSKQEVDESEVVVKSAAVSKSQSVVKEELVQATEEEATVVVAGGEPSNSDPPSSGGTSPERSDEALRRQRQKLDNKVERFFQRMYSVDHTNFESTVVNTIHYGDLSDKYDPKSNQTSVTKTRLLLLEAATVGQEEEQKNQIVDEESSLEIIKIIKANATSSKSLEDLKQSSTNIQELNLVKRNSILYLIERNRNNKIICPFDEFAFLKFKSQEAELESASSPNSNVVNASDLSTTTTTPPPPKANLVELKRFDINNDDFMPNCLSSYLMPFFFDIFQPSELKKITSKMVDILLKLKTSYKPQLFLSEMSTEAAFLTHLVHNCLWNCFALFNRRFHDKYKLGFLNYFISSVCYYRRVLLLNTTTQLVGSKDYSKPLDNFKRIMSLYVEALVLNGFIKTGDLKLVAQLAAANEHSRILSSSSPPQSPHTTTTTNNNDYIQDVVDIMDQVLRKFTPMKLRDMCRILVKRNSKSYFDSSSVKRLKLSEKDAEFLLFNDEFQRYYKEIRQMLDL